jgi:hypothetical protein
MATVPELDPLQPLRGAEAARLADLEQTRLHLPLLDPDRHALDLDADHRFADLAAAHPDKCGGTQ